VELEGHGREELFEGVDLSRTVGWFTSAFPVLLEVPAGGGAGELLRSVKDQLRAVPARGIGFGILRRLSPDAAVRERLAAIPAPQVNFNYLGQFGGRRGGVDAPRGRNPPGPSTHRRRGAPR
jgi:hypothetical protein